MRGGGGDGDNTMGEFVMDGSVQASSGKQPSVPMVALQRLYPDGKNRMVGSILSLSHTNSIYPQTRGGAAKCGFISITHRGGAAYLYRVLQNNC